jgi:alpha-amylase
MLRQAIAVVHSNGMQAYGDLVLHQYGGYPEGKYTTGRFPKTPTCFSIESTVGGVPSDPVPNEQGNYSFGDMACYYTSTPGGYMYFGAITAAQWQTATLGFDGYRIDDVKGTYVGVVRDLVASQPGKFFFGEYFDGNPSAISSWVNYDMRHSCSVLDFAFKFNVGDICNSESNAWMGALSYIGWCQSDASTAVTFCESADTDTTIGEQIVWNKMLGYAIMLTFPGYPRVYYRDWSTDENCYGLKTFINNLIWIHENLAQGEQVIRLGDDPQVFVHERLGYGDAPGCLAAFNNDQYNEYTRTVSTAFGTNQRIHEYTGNGDYYEDIWTDDAGRLTFTLPKNDNGMSYLVFALPGVEGATFSDVALPTTQMIEGSADLAVDGGLGPALSGTLTVTPRLWAAKGTEMMVRFAPSMVGWMNTTDLNLEIASSAGEVIGQLSYDDQGSATQEMTLTCPADDWFTVTLAGTELPIAGSPFIITTTYTAPKGI